MSTHGVVRADKVTINFNRSQIQWLNRLAERHEISVSDAMRRIVDELRGVRLIKPQAALDDLLASQEEPNPEI